MRPTPFEYHRAESLDHALALLAEFGEEGRPLGGGQSLVPMMNLRLARPAHLVDINGLPLDFIEVEGDVLRVGALVRHERYLKEKVIGERFAAFHDAVQWIGHPTIRSRGTIGGSIAHADPSAELPAVAMLYGATIIARSANGERRIAADDFFLGAYMTALEAGEMVVAVEFPLPPAHSAGAFMEISERRSDFATVSVGAQITFSGGSITGARIVATGVELQPIRAIPAEEALSGKPLSACEARAAGRAFAEGIDPISDNVASSEYRRSLAAELTSRAVEKACQRALEAGQE
ncbi:xanthine dehydrogenase family protein subunit M [Afifella sp. IM 167]|uniref:FAD binding domain-containing protein n=1 Tax=Afifella sp. IM 167 TaxID=2033586 RepID=UPI001CCEBA6F|nr:xanthine dehydrogenase family protein subunit M [Afifella sp. IM 167]MBZ8134764.1 molybdopterin dehydrogenase [Afifella sp. IM 167]